MEEPEEEGGESEGGGFQVELLHSYLAFGRRALRAHRVLTAGIFLGGVALTFLVFALFPRTYRCKTTMMALGNAVLERYDAPNPLTGAEGLIMRHDNLEAIIRDIGLLQSFEARRPPLLKAKDRVVAALLGPQSEKVKMASLVGTLESKLEVAVDKGELSISVSWGDGQTAAELVEAARKSFLNARHTAEVSAFEDKMAILDGHATTLREEIAALAEQVSSAHAPAAKPAPAPGAAPRPVVVRTASRAPDATKLEELASLKEKLAAAKPKLAELEAEHSRRLREEEGKLAEMKLRLTPQHPEVVTEQQKVALLSQMPSEIAEMRAQVSTLEGDIKARELAAGRSSSATTSTVAGGAAPAAEQLPAEVMQALQKDDIDPALRAQLSGAIVKYGDLRDGIRSGRIDLDTAQAAFSHRYQIVVPAEVPTKPEKPKPALVIGGGLAVTLLLSLLVPLIGELRKGVIVERWQVQQLRLPVLAELELPPHTD
jgi:uncharacterized protein involved in exopolysaccharide biosynthesis